MILKVTMKSKKKRLNIIYLCTAEKGPSGGAKIIYDHSNHINRLKIQNVTSEVLHIQKKKISKWNTSLKKRFKIENAYSGWLAKDITVNKYFKSKWFKNNIINKENFTFDSKIDFVIFPEIFAHLAKELCIDKKIPYAIFALNGYTLRSTNNYKNLEDSYKKAKFILSVSKNISLCVKLAFPSCSNKILSSSLSVDAKKIIFKSKKSNLITYMPRKLPQHSDLVMFFLKKKLPKFWKIKKIHNMNEKKVFYYLSKSKIFLSFTHFEGLGMPPIEAALAGDKVIGYTGEGGKEIWHKPIFTEIPNGDILKFVDEILKSLNNNKISLDFKLQRNKIINNFSIIKEKKKLIQMIKKIKST
jgi:hypothetical protein